MNWEREMDAAIAGQENGMKPLRIYCENMTEFRGFAKIPRLSRNCTVTEKIDGTNASICITKDGQFLTGSRTRWITPENDNHGFSRWAHEHEEELRMLGVGVHFGEYWGGSIQRGYGIKEKRFSLFNTSIWNDAAKRPTCCHVVPILYQGLFDSAQIEFCLMALRQNGSAAAPGFMQPEGIVVYHEAAGHYFKKTCEHDDEPKNAHVKKEHPPQAKKTNPTGIMWTGGRRKGATPGYVGPERRQG